MENCNSCGLTAVILSVAILSISENAVAEVTFTRADGGDLTLETGHYQIGPSSAGSMSSMATISGPMPINSWIYCPEANVSEAGGRALLDYNRGNTEIAVSVHRDDGLVMDMPLASFFHEPSASFCLVAVL